MGEKAGSRPLRRLLRVAFVSGIAFAGGCLPQSGNDDDDSGKQPLMSFAGSSGNSSTNKGDPLVQVTAATRNLFAGEEAQTPRQERYQTASRDERAVNAAASLAAAPSFTPSLEIDDAPAGTALASFFKTLSALESGRVESPVTILHLGDSHIAADRFSGDMREQFQ